MPTSKISQAFASGNNLKALILLNRFQSCKKNWDLLKQGITPQQACDSLLQEAAGQNEVLDFSVDEEIAACQSEGIRLIDYWHESYPVLLREIPDPPILLYVKGELQDNDLSSVAIVGTRYPNLYGETQARRFARGLAESGITIVSGLAKGIDQAAHEGALEVSHGRTIAVVGCGLDVDYPKGSKSLKKLIANNGALLSEFSLGAQPNAYHFPRRNRIISGLSFGTLVVQANEKSGSLITAGQALDQGRDVFAVPGFVDDPRSTGPHKLIRQGATLVESPQEIFSELREPLKSLRAEMPSSAKDLWDSKSAIKQDLQTEMPVVSSKSPPNKIEQKILQRIRKSREIQLEEITLEYPGQTGEIICALLDMELKGMISRGLNGSYKITSPGFLEIETD